MRFKIAKSETADASNSTAIDSSHPASHPTGGLKAVQAAILPFCGKFANEGVGDFGLMDDIHELISASLVGDTSERF